MFERIQQFVHDGIVVAGGISVIFWAFVALGYVEGICGLHGSDRVWAFNMEGKNYKGK